ncbi:MAG: tyrosine-type recombinase/integrase [Anaerolineae bacterium]|nr:tyrosine-type recombinase/integrase [Anaerolineae bacterium]
MAKSSESIPKLLSEQIADYLGHLFESPRTQHTYETGLNAFVKFLTEQGKPESHAQATTPNPNLTLDSIDTNVLLDFQTWLGKNSYSRFSHKTYLASVVAFLNYALSKDWLPASFSLERSRARLKQVTRRSAYPIPRPDPALPLLIRYYDEMQVPEDDGEKSRRKRLQILRSRAFVHLLYSSAGRLAEVAALDRKDVADGKRKEAIVTGKGDKERFIFITADARAAIALYISQRHDTYEPLFISHARDYGKRLSHVMLWNTIKSAAKKLEMDVSPHDFRHFRARQMLEQGAPLEAIQEILGHSDIGTTRRVYAHYSKPSIRTIFERTTLTPHDAAQRAEANDDNS